MQPEKSMELMMQAAVDYFRSNPGYIRLLERLVAKHRSLGRLSGVIIIDNITMSERSTLEEFFRRSLPGISIRLAANQFIQALRETRFGDLDPLELLVAWQSSQLVSCQHQREAEELKRRMVVETLLEEFPDPLCQRWLQAILKKTVETRIVQKALIADPDFKVNMKRALHALSQLPGQYQRLQVFAQGVCSDPHGLDPDCSAGKLFVEGLQFTLSVHEAENAGETAMSGIIQHSASEDLNELLYRFNLLRDAVLNFATCFGLTAYSDIGELAYWSSATEVGAPLNISMRELVGVTALRPNTASRGARPDNNSFEVFVVENSEIFSALVDECFTVCRPLVCLHGQYKLASWALLDRLIQSGAYLRYSGDFDPEGLQIAQKLFLRYPGRVKLWRMNEADYRQAGPAVTLNDFRLRKLKSIHIPQLESLAQLMATQKLAAYQEGLLPELERDLLVT